MLDNYELAKREFEQLVEVCRRQGLNSWEILGIILILANDLFIRAEVEYRVNLR